MPYHLDGNCVKTGTEKGKGETVKCHKTREEAEKHMKALYANVPDAKHSIEEMEASLAEMAPPEQPVKKGSRIRLYYQEGEQSIDRRVIDINATNFNRPPPWSLTLQLARGDGHSGAIIAGVLDKAMRDGSVIVVEGRLDMNGEGGQEAERLIREGILQTWSPDLGDCTIDMEENVTDEDGQDPTHQLEHFVEGTFNGGTLVAMPALASAVVELLDEEGNVIVPALKREPVTDEAEDVNSAPPQKVERVAASGFSTTTSGNVSVGDMSVELFIPENKMTVVPDSEVKRLNAISACAGPSHPPASFFAKQDIPELTRWVEITSDGHVYGHAAGFGECHIGYLDQCVTIEMIADCRGEGSFEYAMPGHVITAEGTKVATGPLPIKGGHAPKGSTPVQAMAHYDDPSAVVADVCYYMDEHGVQYSGAIRATATEAQVQALRASGVSLDARQIGGKLRYLATCAVNTPGFPKASARIAASGEQQEVIELVAAGGQPLPAPDSDCGCGEPSTVIRAAEPDKRLDTVLDIMRASGITQQAIESLEADLPAEG